MKRLLLKLLAPVIAAVASLAARYAVQKAPEVMENTVLPWLREAADSAGSATEKLPDAARSAVSTGGDLAEKLTDRAREATGGSDSSGSGQNGRDRRLSREQLSERSEDRAKRRAERRKATKRK